MNIQQTRGKLQTYYRRYVDETALTIDWSAFDAAQYDAVALERGRRAWSLRTNDEYRSMLGFSEMTHVAAELQAPIDIIACGSRVIRDEVRHVELCGQLTDLLGGRPRRAPEPNYVRTNPNHHLNVRAMQLAIGSCCIGETVSVILLAGVRERATDSVAHAVLTQMLKDESFHSRFGWLWLEHMHLKDRDHRWLDAYVPRVFAGMEPDMVPPQAAGEFLDHPFGAMPTPERVERFYTAIDNIVEAFEERGLPGRRWWDNRRQYAA